MRLSIVIPVYNVEQYLDDCVTSAICNLSDTDEIVLVDDGSTDSSGVKCNEWENKEPRIKVLHKENGGLMSAWKYGVIRAEGEYIGFVDSDDWIDGDMYTSMLSVAKENNADIVCAGLVKEYSNGTRQNEVMELDAGIYGITQIRNVIFPQMIYNSKTHNRGFSPNRVTKLFTKKILMSVLNVCDDRVSIGEDLLTSFACFSKANCICIMNNYFPYHYRINDSSMIMRYSDSKYAKINTLRQAMLNVNETCTYDFSKQIHNDYISLLLGQLDQEMLFSGKTKDEIYLSMRKICDSELSQESLREGDKSHLSFKNKMYIKMMQHAKWLLLFIRKVKKR